MPADLGVMQGNTLVMPKCEHCGVVLPVEGRYGLCAECGRYHRTDYEICPFKVDGLDTGASATESPGPYSIEAQKRRPKKRSDEYYWQLYFDYRDKQDEDSTGPQVPSAGPAEESSTEEEPPHPADMAGYVPAGSNGNGYGRTPYGNGANGGLYGHGTNGNGNGKGNGYANGNGKKNGHGAATRVDLAVAESVSLTLFPEIEAVESVEEAAPTHVSSAGNYNEFEYELISDPSRLAEVAELLASEKVVGLDTETTGLDPYTAALLLLQVSTTDRVYIVDCKRVVPLALKPLLENPDVMKVAQNAKFEYVMLRQQAGITVNNLFDTMLAERLLTAGIGREISLKAIAHKYIGATLDKSVRESFYKLAMHGDAYLAPEQLHYAARDAYIMIPVWRQILPDLKKQRLVQVAELEFRCIPAVGDLELAGVQIDVDRWRKIIADVAVQREKSAEELSELLAPATMQATMFGVPSINLNSNVQLLDAFATLGVNLPDTMEATLVKFDHPAVAKLLEYRSHEKTLSAFGENVLGLINSRTGRIHPDFNQYGADTGRFSCTKPNVQQIPATSDFRKCFVAAPGYKLVTCVAAGTRIATTRGLLPIEDVEVGDRVLQEDGSARCANRVINQGIRPTVKIKTSLGYEIEATPEHRVRVIDGDGCYVWREVQHLAETDRIAIKLATPFCENAVPPALEYAESEHCNSVNRKLPESVTPELATLFGYITGDGTLCEDYVGSVVNAQDEDLAEHLAQSADRLFAIQGRTYTYRGVIEHRLHSKQLLKWLRKAGVAKDRVPSILWTSSTNLIAAYLRGLFEADGSVQNTNTGRISFSTIHEQLAREVQQLLAALGIASARKKVEHGKGIGYIWVITIPSNWKSRFRREVGFLSQRKRNALDALILTYKVNQHTGGMPILRARARALAGKESGEVNLLLANTRFRGSVVSEDLSRQIREVSATAYAQLELYRVVEYSVIFDMVKSVAPGETQLVYDLTVEGTSTYVSHGFVSHNCDYSQAELRILAELSGDEAFVSAFKSGQDLHTLTASQMFGVPVDQVQKPQRSAAKAINFGLAYGMGPGGLAPRLGVSLDESKSLISKYFAAYPGIQRWLDKAAKDAVRLGYSVTPLGRKRFYNMPDESLKRQNEDEWRRQIGAIERQGKNSPIQGCVVGSTRIFEETHGYVPIESLRGQVVSVWDGTTFSQAVVVYSGKKQLVRIHLWDGNYIECSPDHRFLVRPTTGSDMWKTPAEFKAQNKLILGEAVPPWSLVPTMPVRRHSPVWNAKNVSLSQITDPAALGEWLGRLASDGSLHNGAACLLVAEHEEEVLLPRLREISPQLGYVGYSVRSTLEKPKRFHRLNISSRAIVHELRELGIKERVPDCAWQNGALLAGYLRGMFDGDGTVNRDDAFLVFGRGAKHLRWAREIQQALLLFGIRSRVNVCADRINVRVVKKDVPIFCEQIGFMNPQKQAKAESVSARVTDINYGRGVRVKSVEFTDKWVDMYDVVNSQTARFMANGLIVHNCNADMTKLALINLRAALRRWDARTVNTVHDEIVVEAREDQAEEVKHIVEGAMIGAGQAILKEVPILADASIADYWSK